MATHLLRGSFVVLSAVILCAPAGAGTLLSEDFNGFADDAAVTAAGWQIVDENSPAENAAWTITNPGGRNNPPTRSGTPSDGKFMVSDSDAAGGDNPTGSGMSHDLWSPSIDCSTAAAVWLHFDVTAQLNNNGKAVFDVDVSTDDGTTWLNVFRRVAPDRTATDPLVTLENADGYFGRLDIDLTDQAAIQSNVKVRWRHFEPSDDWWIAMDNVLVDTVPAAQGGELVLLANEDFSGGIPATWTTRSTIDPPNTGTSTWNTSDACSRSSAVGGTVQQQGANRLDASFAILDSDCDPDPTQNEYLITPVIDCSAAEAVFLHYKSETVYASSATAEVLLSLDGGLTFLPAPIFSYNAGAGADNGEEPFYAERVFRIPAAIGEAQVAFAFHYVGGDNWWWAVDDVMVTSGTGIVERTCEDTAFEVALDSETGAVTATWNGLPSDEGYRILRGTQQIGDDLPADTESFTDESPPLGGEDILYTIEVLAEGAVAIECAAAPIDTFACPGDLRCCTTDSETGSATLTWNKGANLLGTAFQILRNGQAVTTVDLATDSYTDVPGPGVFTYEVALAGTEPDFCPDMSSCRAQVAGGMLRAMVSRSEAGPDAGPRSRKKTQ